MGIILYQSLIAYSEANKRWIQTTAYFEGESEKSEPSQDDSHIPYYYEVDETKYWYANPERQFEPEILIYYNSDNPFESVTMTHDPWDRVRTTLLTLSVILIFWIVRQSYYP